MHVFFLVRKGKGETAEKEYEIDTRSPLSESCGLPIVSIYVLHTFFFLLLLVAIDPSSKGFETIDPSLLLQREGRSHPLLHSSSMPRVPPHRSRRLSSGGVPPLVPVPSVSSSARRGSNGPSGPTRRSSLHSKSHSRPTSPLLYERDRDFDVEKHKTTDSTMHPTGSVGRRRGGGQSSDLSRQMDLIDQWRREYRDASGGSSSGPSRDKKETKPEESL